MTPGFHLQVIGIKETATIRISALEDVGCVPTIETVRCLHCQERYLLLIDPGETALENINILDLGRPIRRLVEQVTADHASGHTSELLVVEHQPGDKRSNAVADPAGFLNLRPGERITSSWAAELVQDCRLCAHCQGEAFRLVQVSTQTGKHRYVPICSEMFMEACKAIPELVDFELDSVLRQVHQKMRA